MGYLKKKTNNKLIVHKMNLDAGIINSYVRETLI